MGLATRLLASSIARVGRIDRSTLCEKMMKKPPGDLDARVFLGESGTLDLPGVTLHLCRTESHR
jgi:hypothetical protein